MLARRSVGSMRQSLGSRRVRAGVVVAAAATVIAGLVLGAAPVGAAPRALPSGSIVPTDGTFVPIAPCRLLDSRPGGTAASLASGATVALQIAGISIGGCAGMIPSSTDVAAAVLNVTAVPAVGSFGYLTVYPADQVRPATSNVNFHSGEIIPDLVTATLSTTVGTAGQIRIFNGGTGRVHYVVDAEGYYLRPGSSLAAGSLYHPITPCRLVDSRPSQGGAGPLASMGTRSVLVANVATGDCNGKIPSGITAVAVNTTAIAETAHASYGYLTVYPSDVSAPASSNLDFSTGETIPNLVETKVSADGHVTVLNGAVGNVDFILDVQGYYAAPGAGGGLKYVPITPSRVLDTRSDQSGLDPDVNVGTIDFTQPEGDLPTGTAAIVWNVTAVPDTTAPSFGFITVYPDAASPPATSNLDFKTGQYISNLVISGLSGAGIVDVASGAVGYVDVIGDLQGYLAVP